MSLLSELTALIDAVGLPVETGIFSSQAPDEYVVVTPLSEIFSFHADNFPLAETQEARLSLFSKNNYNKAKNQLVKSLLQADFIITDRRYVGYEENYHNYAIDVMKCYETEVF